MKRKAAAILLGVSILTGSAFGMTAIAGIDVPQAETEVTAEDTTAEDTETVESAEEVTRYLSSANNTDKMDVEEVVAHALPSVVCITTKSISEVQDWFTNRVYSDEVTGGGSGIICKKTENELLILTNSHVVEDATEVTVTFCDEETYEGKVKGFDSASDLAIVSIPLDEIEEDTEDVITVADFGDSDALNLGEQVVAIGNALGYGQSVTVGYVSALNRSLSAVSYGLIQTDAAINSGNSGGALLNMEGEVIGINSYKYASTGVEGMGYAIPITTVDEIIRNLAERETRSEIAPADEASRLGITGNTVSDDVQLYYNIPSGVYIASVEEGSAADNAGMIKGQVITKFDGITISDMDGLKNLMRYYRAGETVEICVMEADSGEYKEKILTVILDKAEVDEATYYGTPDNNEEDENDSEDRGEEYSYSPFFGFGSGSSSPFTWGW